MSPVASTSRDAYMTSVLDGKKSRQTERVLAALRAHPGATRNDLAGLFDTPTWDGGTTIRLSSICSAVWTLEEAGQVKYDGKKKDPETGHNGDRIWPVVPAPVQRTFEDFMR